VSSEIFGLFSKISKKGALKKSSGSLDDTDFKGRLHGFS
jgi:hypothetical protein